MLSDPEGPKVGVLAESIPAVPSDPGFQPPPTWYRTQKSLDIAIEGHGYFVLRDPESATRPPILSRVGAFLLDWDGNLLSQSGYRVQGVSTTESIVTDLKIPQGQSIHGAAIQSFHIEPTGAFVVHYHDGTTRTAGTIALWQPTPNSRLRRLSDNDFCDPTMPENWRERLTQPDGITCRLHTGFLQFPDPELEVVAFHKNRLSDTPTISMRTGLEFSVALDGPGLLIVRDPKTAGFYATRCGLMHRDSDGWLVTVPDGYRVQGWTNRALTLTGDLRIDDGDRPPEATDRGVAASRLTASGDLVVLLADGTSYTRGRIWVGRIPASVHLREVRHGLYAIDPSETLPILSTDTVETSTELTVGRLDPRFLSPERQEWIHRRYRFLQKSVTRTGIASHLAMAGNGYFQLRDPRTGRRILTRSGLFHWSDDGYLEGLHGWRLQGWDITQQFIQAIDIRTYHGRRPTSSDHYYFTAEGNLGFTEPSGITREELGLCLVNVPDPMILQELEPHHYLLPEIDPDAARPRCSLGIPGQGGLGKLIAGALEDIWREEFWQVQDIPDTARLLQWRGLAGRHARIQISSDMKTWENWMTIDSSGHAQGGWFDAAHPQPQAVTISDLVLDAENPQGNARFYRLLVQPDEFPWNGW